VPFPTDASPVQRRSVTVHRNVPSAVLHSIPGQKNRPGKQPESDTLAQNRPCEAGRSLLPERDDASGCGTTILQDQDAHSAQRNFMPLQQNSLQVQRNTIPLVQDSIQEQLSGVSRAHFMTEMAKFHQFRHFSRSLSSNHTHGDAHITVHFLYFLSRRHNAAFSFTRQ
jgi:hypothetical protein